MKRLFILAAIAFAALVPLPSHATVIDYSFSTESLYFNEPSTFIIRFKAPAGLRIGKIGVSFQNPYVDLSTASLAVSGISPGVPHVDYEPGYSGNIDLRYRLDEVQTLLADTWITLTVTNAKNPSGPNGSVGFDYILISDSTTANHDAFYPYNDEHDTTLRAPTNHYVYLKDKAAPQPSAPAPAPAPAPTPTPTPLPPPATCTEDTWSCSDWSVCSDGGRQTRTCNKTYECQSVENPSPEVSKSCEPIPPPIAPSAPTPNEEVCAADTWTCGDWDICSLSGIRGRSCTRTFDCPHTETPPPGTVQYCEAPMQPRPVQPDSPDAATNQDAIIQATVKLVCPIDETTASQGSGTIIDPSGTILTNKHVIDGTSGCFVGFITTYRDEPYFDARQIADIINVSPDQDMAILKLHNPQNQTLPSINIAAGQSAYLPLGSRITTYGYPARFGTTITYTSGDFSGTVPGFLKTSAIIEHGNSGGGAYLRDGTFIGVPTAVVRGELNALGYILAIDDINAWRNNKPLIYNPSTNNNYSRVRQILEHYSVKKLSALKLAMPTKSSPRVTKNNKGVTAAPDKIDSIKQSTEEQKFRAEKLQSIPSSQEDKESKTKTTSKLSWFKRIIRWIKELF